MCSSEPGLGVICQSSWAIAGSRRNKPKFGLSGVGVKGKVQIVKAGPSGSFHCLTQNLYATKKLGVSKCG
jgi:hypothetical protein